MTTKRYERVVHTRTGCSSSHDGEDLAESDSEVNPQCDSHFSRKVTQGPDSNRGRGEPSRVCDDFESYSQACPGSDLEQSSTPIDRHALSLSRDRKRHAREVAQKIDRRRSSGSRKSKLRRAQLEVSGAHLAGTICDVVPVTGSSHVTMPSRVDLILTRFLKTGKAPADLSPDEVATWPRRDGVSKLHKFLVRRIAGAAMRRHASKVDDGKQTNTERVRSGVAEDPGPADKKQKGKLKITRPRKPQRLLKCIKCCRTAVDIDAHNVACFNGTLPCPCDLDIDGVIHHYDHPATYDAARDAQSMGLDPMPSAPVTAPPIADPIPSAPPIFSVIDVPLKDKSPADDAPKIVAGTWAYNHDFVECKPTRAAGLNRLIRAADRNQVIGDRNELKRKEHRRLVALERLRSNYQPPESPIRFFWSLLTAFWTLAASIVHKPIVSVMRSTRPLEDGDRIKSGILWSLNTLSLRLIRDEVVSQKDDLRPLLVRHMTRYQHDVVIQTVRCYRLTFQLPIVRILVSLALILFVFAPNFSAEFSHKMHLTKLSLSYLWDAITVVWPFNQILINVMTNLYHWCTAFAIHILLVDAFVSFFIPERFWLLVYIFQWINYGMGLLISIYVPTMPLLLVYWFSRSFKFNHLFAINCPSFLSNLLVETSGQLKDVALANAPAVYRRSMQLELDAKLSSSIIRTLPVVLDLFEEQVSTDDPLNLTLAGFQPKATVPTYGQVIRDL